MMGSKARTFAPLPAVTLEDLVPPDSFSRQLERSLNLGFVRDLVRDTYADAGRPSIAPVIFFKGMVGAQDFVSDAAADACHCPGGQTLRFLARLGARWPDPGR